MTDKFHRRVRCVRREGSLALGLAVLLVVGYLLLVPVMIAGVASGQRAYFSASLKAYAALVVATEAQPIHGADFDSRGGLVIDAGGQRCASAVAGLRAFGERFVDADSYAGERIISHAAVAAAMVSAASIIAHAGCAGVPSADAVWAQLVAVRAGDARVRGPADLVARLVIPAPGGWFSMRRVQEKLWQTVLASPNKARLRCAADSMCSSSLAVAQVSSGGTY